MSVPYELESLLKTFQELNLPPMDELSPVEVLHLPTRVYLTKTSKAQAAFLVERDSESALAGRDIGKIRVTSLHWQTEGESRPRPALLITLLSRDPSTLRGFIIAALGLIPAIQRVDDDTALAYLGDLAAALSERENRELTVRGLWGELFFMKQFPTVDLGAAAWQHSGKERFDFAVADDRYEIKTYGGATRKLQFRHQQLHVEAGQTLTLCSMRLIESAAGLSVVGLAARIVNDLSDPAAKVRVLTALDKVADTEAQESELLFDVTVAEQTIALTPEDKLPRLNALLPAGVVDAHLTIDITNDRLRECGFAEVQKFLRTGE